MFIGARKVDAIIFDFDGTLADSMWVWNEVDLQFFAKRYIPFDREYVESFAVLGFEAGADFAVEKFHLDEKPEDIIAEWKAAALDSYSTQVMLKPGAREYLKYCKSCGTPLAIATSLQRNLLVPALKNNEVLGMFDTLCICDELHTGGKSNPKVYLEAACRLNVDPARCAIFEDVVTPAQSAKQTGAYVVGVYDEHKQQATDVLKTVVDRFVYSYQELLDEAGQRIS